MSDVLVFKAFGAEINSSIDLVDKGTVSPCAPLFNRLHQACLTPLMLCMLP